MSFLPLDINYVTAEMIQKAKDELGESPSLRKECLIELRKKIKEIPDFVCLEDENFLLMFLRFSKYNVMKAAKHIRTFYFEMAKNEDIFGNLDIGIIKTMYEENIINLLPFRDADGCAIVLISLDRFKFDEMKFSAFQMALTVTALCAVSFCTANQICGLKFLVEIKSIGVRHLKYIPPRHIILIARAITGLLPVRYKALHFLNPSPVINILRSIGNLVLSEKMKKRVFFHSGEDLPKYFDSSILPKIYGGKLDCNNEFLMKKLPEFERRVCEFNENLK